MSAVPVQSNRAIEGFRDLYQAVILGEEGRVETLCSDIMDKMLNVDLLSISDRAQGIIHVKEVKRCLGENNDLLKKIESQLKTIEKTCRTFSRESLVFRGFNPSTHLQGQARYSSTGYTVSEEIFRDILSKEVEINSQEVLQAISSSRSHRSAKIISTDQLSRLDAAQRVGIRAVRHSMSSFQGTRSSMLDASFYLAYGLQGSLAGVFDGSGPSGAQIANTAKEISMQIFSEILEEVKGDVYLALTLLACRIGKAITDLNMEGSSKAVFSFVQPSGEVWTATLGSNQAYLYKSVDNELRCLPLSDHIRMRGLEGFSRKNLMDGPELSITKQFVNQGDILFLASTGISKSITFDKIRYILESGDDDPAKTIIGRVKKQIISVANEFKLMKEVEKAESVEEFLDRVTDSSGGDKTFEERFEECRSKVRSEMQVLSIDNLSVIVVQF